MGSASPGMAPEPEPGLFRDVLPAWSDPNLKSLTAQVQSHLFLAHVRASTGTATSRNNCHPFVHGRWSFMHNGQVGGYDAFRRDADMMIPSKAFIPIARARPTARRCSLSPLPRGWTTTRAGRWNGRRRASSGFRPGKGAGAAPADDRGPVGRQAALCRSLLDRRCGPLAVSPLVRYASGPGRGLRAAGGRGRTAGRKSRPTASAPSTGADVRVEEFMPCRLAAAA